MKIHSIIVIYVTVPVPAFRERCDQYRLK